MEKKEKDLAGIFLTIFFAVLMCNIYFIVGFGEQYLLIGCMTALDVILFYCSFNSIYKNIKNNIAMKNEQYELHMKSQKAICLLQKSVNEKIEKLFEELKEELHELNEERTSENRALVKATIKSLYKKIDELNAAIAALELNSDNSEKKDDETYSLAFDMEKLRGDLVGAIMQLSDTLSEQISKIDFSTISVSGVNVDVDTDNFLSGEEPVEEDTDKVEKVFAEEESQEAEEVLMQEEPESVEEIPAEEEVLSEEKGLVEVPTGEETPEEESQVEVPEEEKFVPEEQPVQEETTEEESVEEEKGMDVADIDLSNPNRELSADEIAALFASMGN